MDCDSSSFDGNINIKNYGELITNSIYLTTMKVPGKEQNT